MEKKDLGFYLKYLRSNNLKLCFTIANRKGGVGKSLVSQSVAKVLADAGFKVLLCDLDGQQSTTNVLGINNAYENNPVLNIKNIAKESNAFRNEKRPKTYMVDDLLGEPDELELFESKYNGLHTLIKTLVNRKPITKELIDSCIVKPKMIVPKFDKDASEKIANRGMTLEELDELVDNAPSEEVFYGFDLLPSSEEIVDDELILGDKNLDVDTQMIVPKIIDAIKKYCDYDVIIIDTAPSLGLFTINSMRAADGIVLVGMADKQSIYSLAKIKYNIRQIKKDYPTMGGIVGFVLNAAKESDMLKPIMEHYVKDELHIKFFDTLIPKRVSASKASSTGLTYAQMDKEVYTTFQTLCSEIFESYFDMADWDARRERMIKEWTVTFSENQDVLTTIQNNARAALEKWLKEKKDLSIEEFTNKNGIEKTRELLKVFFNQEMRKEIITFNKNHPGKLWGVRTSEQHAKLK